MAHVEIKKIWLHEEDNTLDIEYSVSNPRGAFPKIQRRIFSYTDLEQNLWTDRERIDTPKVITIGGKEKLWLPIKKLIDGD